LIVHVLSVGDPAQRTGGYLYNARMVRGLRAGGHTVCVHRVEGALPELGPGVILADGLLWTDLGPAGAALARQRPVAVLVHSPLWREQGHARRQEEERALRPASRVIATSRRTAGDLDVDALVVEPGTDPVPAAVGSGGTRWLCVATVTPRKGHDVLAKAVRALPGSWSVRCAGSLTRAPRWADQVQGSAPERVAFLGELDAAGLAAEYAAADAVVHAAHYEGWGMGLAEALVRGLPVVSTPAGLFEGRDPDAWLPVPAGDSTALAAAMARVQDEPALRGALGSAARGLGLPDWPTQVAALARALEAL